METGPLQYRFRGLDGILHQAASEWEQLPYFLLQPRRNGYRRRDGTVRLGAVTGPLSSDEMRMVNFFNLKHILTPRHACWEGGKLILRIGR
jgi:hypothetical protein